MHQAASKPERRLPALAVSRGIGIGPVVFLHGERRQFFRIDLDSTQIEIEVERFRSAVLECTNQLKELTANGLPAQNHPVSSIFGVHLLIIEESSLVAKVETVIREYRVNSEWALKVVSDQYLERQGAVADLHFREKYLDIEDVSERLLNALIGSPSSAKLTNSGAVIVAPELRPSAIMELMKSNPAALITERGGWTSHASILAREFSLPMVSGVRRLDQTFVHGDHVIVDGLNGQVILDPTPKTVEHFSSVAAETDIRITFPTGINTSTVTNDGVNIVIRANLDIPEAYQTARLFGAEGIGLFRSESLISNPGSIPSEEEQFLAYRQIAEVAGDAGVKIRTFDTGIDQISDGGFSSERNPALGLRSIRLSILDSAHFRTQVRAILRASADRKIDIILPMISSVGEVLICSTMINEERERLTKESIPFGEVKIGAMIEVPSAVLTAGEIARNVDFMCLGTNDLVQYLLAVDRDNDSVAEWYQTLHPAVVRAIIEVFRAGDGNGVPVAVCGEMAGSAFYVPLLIGLGARELSMNVNSIPQIRHLVSGIGLSETNEIVAIVKNCLTADETEQVLREYYLENWPNLFPSGLLHAKHR